MTKVRASVWVLAVLMIAGSAAGCGQVSDRAQQEAEKKVENKGQQARAEAKEKQNTSRDEDFVLIMGTTIIVGEREVEGEQ